MTRRSASLAFAMVAAAAVSLALTGTGGATVSGANGQIAFSRQLPNGGAQVFRVNPDGTHEQQVPLVDPAEDFAVPRWSPDGNRLLVSDVVRFDDSGNFLPFRPATVNLDGSDYTLLDPPGAPFGAGCFGGWSPDGSRLLCEWDAGPPGAYSIRSSDGGDPRRLTMYPFDPNCNGCDEPTDVSPDGTRFLFLRYRRENFVNDRAQQVALFVENLDGTGLHQLTPYGLAFPHELAGARWSPDGQSIISETTQGKLFVVDVDGSGLGLRVIPLQTGTPSYFAFQPTWSPDGTQIAFGMFIGGQEDIYTANADGSNLHQVTDTPDFEEGPDWGTHPLAP